jgi:hypothetical protein
MSHTIVPYNVISYFVLYGMHHATIDAVLATIVADVQARFQ